MISKAPIEPTPQEMSPREIGAYPPTVVPKWDVLRRDRLPAVDGMELEYREAPKSRFSESSVAAARFAFAAVAAFLAEWSLGAACRAAWGLIPPSGLYPVWVLLSIFLALTGLLKKVSAHVVGLLFVSPLLASIVLELAYAGGGLNRLFLSVLLGAALGIFADSVVTHFVYWLSADPYLTTEFTRRVREEWGSRVRSWRYLSGGGLVLYVVLLAAAGCPAWAMVLSSAAGCIALLLLASAPVEEGTRLSIAAFSNYLTWGRWAAFNDAPTPGLFRSPRGTAGTRLAGTMAVLYLLTAVFSEGAGGGPWKTVFALSFRLLVPAVVTMLCILALGAVPLVRIEQQIREERETRKSIVRNDWEAYAAKLRNSKHPLEQEHLWLGVHAEAGYPILLHKNILREHGHMVGDTGSGKTALGLAPLVVQLIQRGDSAVVVIDLKGDMAMFEAVRLEAERGGRTFKYFTNTLGRSSYVFNPYQQTNTENVSLSQFVETIMESLRLNHGDGYGARFFSSQSREWLLRTVKTFPTMESFEELCEKTTMDFFANQAERDRVLEAIAVVRQIADVQALNWRGKSWESDEILRNAIFMPDVVSKKEVIYFWLPAADETLTVREIGQLTLYALFQAVKTHHAAHAANYQTYLIIDEFQRMASSGFELILQQARSFGLGVVLANQTIADLRRQDAPTLLNVVRGNTRFRQYFSASDPLTQETLQQESGETILLGSDDSEKVGTRHSLNDIKAYSSDALTSIVEITRDSGYSCFGGHWFAASSSFHIDKEEYTRRNDAWWPDGSDATIRAKRQDPRPDELIKPVQTIVSGAAAIPESAKGEPAAEPKPKSALAERLETIYRKRRLQLPAEFGDAA